jgi:phage tail-like protein
MGDDGSARSGAVWPLPRFRFAVDLGFGVPASFQEVSGLESETQVIEYRHGDHGSFSPIKMPRITKFATVTLRKGVLAADPRFWTWYDQMKMNAIERRTVTVDLLDEAGKPVMRWALANAWPTKISMVDLKSDGNEVAIETMEIAHESLSVTTPR